MLRQPSGMGTGTVLSCVGRTRRIPSVGTGRQASGQDKAVQHGWWYNKTQDLCALHGDMVGGQ